MIWIFGEFIGSGNPKKFSCSQDIKPKKLKKMAKSTVNVKEDSASKLMKGNSSMLSNSSDFEFYNKWYTLGINKIYF